MTRLVVAALVALLVVAGSAPAEPSANRPRTLFTASSIDALGQDGDRVVWANSDHGSGGPRRVGSKAYAERCRTILQIRRLSTGRATPLPLGADLCDLVDRSGFGEEMALAGERTIFELGEQITSRHSSVIVTAAPGARPRSVAGDDDHGWEKDLPLAGDAGTLVGYDGTKAFTVDRAGRARTVKRAWPARAVAASGRRFAVAWVKAWGGCICNGHGAWSPDGKQIAFTSKPLRTPVGRRDLSGQNVILIVDADGSNLRRVLVVPRGAEQLTWSSDGTTLAFTTGERLALVGVDGTRYRVLSRGRSPTWSPVSDEIAYVRGAGEAARIYVRSASGGAERELAAGASLAWSPGGRMIAFTRAGRSGGLFVIPPAQGAARRVAAGDASFPTWSPDGARLAYNADDDIVVVRGDGTARRVVARDDARGSLMWSRQGNLIAYEGWGGRDDGLPSVQVVGADGSGAATVGGGSLPQWAPHSTELLYLRQEYELEEPRLVVHEPGRRGERLLAAVTPEADLQRVEIITTASHRTVDAFDLGGKVLDLGFTRSSVAVLIEERSRRIELRALTGRVRWRVKVGDVTRLAASGRWIVFADGKTLRAIDAQTARSRVLVRGRDLHGLSLEGKRVIWAEEGPARARRVVALDLP